MRVEFDGFEIRRQRGRDRVVAGGRAFMTRKQANRAARALSRGQRGKFEVWRLQVGSVAGGYGGIGWDAIRVSVWRAGRSQRRPRKIARRGGE